MLRLLITIDGPTATGKTSVARELACRLGIFHLRGGIFLRSLTNKCLLLNCRSEELIRQVAEQHTPVLRVTSGQDYVVEVDGINVEGDLWTPQVDAFVSFVADIAEVRVARKRWLSNVAENRDLVADGRTLGTEIFPLAPFKFYLTCDVRERALRRAKQPQYAGAIETIQRDIVERDWRDSTGLINRLTCPSDAVVIDSTLLNLDRVVHLMLERINNTEKGTRPP